MMPDLIVFIPACLTLNLAFGPNNLLSLTYGAQQGVRFAVIAGMARLIVFIPMILATTLGLRLLMVAASWLFIVIKLLGAAYLIYLGIRLFRSASTARLQNFEHSNLTLAKGLRSEAIIAASNPKAMLIFAAFFPQFIDPSNFWFSYTTVTAIFLPLEIVAIFVYAAIGRSARTFARHRLHWLQRGSGIGMMVFGFVLLFSPSPNSTVIPAPGR